MRSNNRSQILLIGTGSDLETKLCTELRARAYGVATASRGDEGLAKAMELTSGVVVSEINTPGLSGLEFLRRLLPMRPSFKVILIDRALSERTATKAASLGAFQVLSKPFDFSELLESIRRAALSSQPIFGPLEPGEAEFEQTGLIGSSQPMRKLYQEIRTAASSSISVLILGATGTGKELIARAIHQLSSRAKHPFIPINCNEITPTLFESTVFGHERGAFTGARDSRAGCFEQAKGGTLFLDEIGDLDMTIQVKLLRVLQEGCVVRVGGHSAIPLDIHVIAATNRDLDQAMQVDQFRKDLFYRLYGFLIRVPELKNHPEDIRDLVRYSLRKFHKDSASRAPSIWPQAVKFFEKQPWPGNVRELENAVRRAVLLAQGQPIGCDHVEQACEPLNPTTKDKRRAGVDTPTDLIERAKRGEAKNVHATVMGRAEESLIRKTMAHALGNKAKAARWLGLRRETLREKLRRYGILPPFWN
jgi:DNA-binding NtrC family response regulator